MATVAQACRTCSHGVYWLKNERTKKPAPIDAEPSAFGNIRIDLDAGTYTIVPAGERANAGELHVNHFMTCPQAKSWAQQGRYNTRTN